MKEIQRVTVVEEWKAKTDNKIAALIVTFVDGTQKAISFVYPLNSVDLAHGLKCLADEMPQ